MTRTCDWEENDIEAEIEVNNLGNRRNGVLATEVYLEPDFDFECLNLQGQETNKKVLFVNGNYFHCHG